VQEYDVQLPDEYDQIYEDLEPFWRLEPTEPHNTQKELENHDNSYTLGKTDEGHVVLGRRLPVQDRQQHDH